MRTLQCVWESRREKFISAPLQTAAERQTWDLFRMPCLGCLVSAFTCWRMLGVRLEQKSSFQTSTCVWWQLVSTCWAPGEFVGIGLCRGRVWKQTFVQCCYSKHSEGTLCFGDWLSQRTEKAMLAGRRLSRFKRVGWFSRQIRKIKAEAWWRGTTVLKQQMPCFQEKPLSIR